MHICCGPGDDHIAFYVQTSEQESMRFWQNIVGNANPPEFEQTAAESLSRWV